MQKAPLQIPAPSKNEATSSDSFLSNRFAFFVAATAFASAGVTHLVIRDTADQVTAVTRDETGRASLFPVPEASTISTTEESPIQPETPAEPPIEVPVPLQPPPQPTSDDPEAEEPQAEQPDTRLVTFTPEDELVLSRYSARYALAEQRHNHNTFNRTFPHRLVDHEILLQAILDVDSGDDSMVIFRDLLFPGSFHSPFFIDIGPGIANKDLTVGGGNGKPAITMQELAEAFPRIPFIALDLPSEVDIFLGKTPKSEVGYVIDHNDRQEFFAHSNVHIVSGDGLKPLKEQLDDASTNPIPDRKRPDITAQTTIFARAANSIDIYCSYEEVKLMLITLALDYQKNPICFFYNRQILLKPAGSLEWRAVGQTSNMGFRHSNRVLTRDGEPPFKLHVAILREVEQRTRQRSNTAQRGVVVPKLDGNESM